VLALANPPRQKRRDRSDHGRERGDERNSPPQNRKAPRNSGRAWYEHGLDAGAMDHVAPIGMLIRIGEPLETVD
jgi:hypothetical protein